MKLSNKWLSRTLIGTITFVGLSTSAMADISQRTTWTTNEAEQFLNNQTVPSQGTSAKPAAMPESTYTAPTVVNNNSIPSTYNNTNTPTYSNNSSYNNYNSYNSYSAYQPNVTARAALVMDAKTGEILYKKNTTATLPIASVTKVMTAMVTLDAGLNMHEQITLNASDFAGAGGKNSSSTLKVGDTMNRAELLLFALMKSENPAAAALGRTYPGGKYAFAQALNDKARSLGMYSSYFTEASGLDPKNVSTAEDLARMVKAAVKYDVISRFSTTSSHDFNLGYRMLKSNNTNALVRNGGWDLQLSKTGFINEAGRCVVMHANINARPTIVVLLNARDSQSRTTDATTLFNWVAGLPQGI